MGYVPKINLPLEGVEHARWLEKRALEQEKFNAEVRAFMARSARDSSAGARQTAVINNRHLDTTAAVEATNGMPPGGTTGQMIRKTSSAEGAAQWTTEWQGLMPEYWVSLSSAGGSYYVSAMSLLNSEAEDETRSLRLLPPVQFADGGTTMLPIGVGNYPDAVGGFGGQGQSPIHLYVEVNPSTDDEEFTIYPPTSDNSLGVTSPFYTFDLSVVGPHSAVVHIENTALFYEGTLTPVLGAVEPWNLPSGFAAAWFVRNVHGWGAVAAPMVSWDGVTASFSDEYYETNVYTP
ncbi:hypothetical protein J2X63_003167 [Agromyces sp. 3263]|uniref:hypothetical protein n=1 Tax=Agromyces sp. 3263 TaxID=2817750 RepID=UPI00285E1FC6|nr:hypothetical protein [Agromyces sp. 3263]MDR6907459.1 hypothetical protein [Agromyces sp. 3263]